MTKNLLFVQSSLHSHPSLVRSGCQVASGFLDFTYALMNGTSDEGNGIVPGPEDVPLGKSYVRYPVHAVVWTSTNARHRHVQFCGGANDASDDGPVRHGYCVAAVTGPGHLLVLLLPDDDDGSD